MANLIEVKRIVSEKYFFSIDKRDKALSASFAPCYSFKIGFINLGVRCLSINLIFGRAAYFIQLGMRYKP